MQAQEPSRPTNDPSEPLTNSVPGPPTNSTPELPTNDEPGLSTNDPSEPLTNSVPGPPTNSTPELPINSTPEPPADTRQEWGALFASWWQACRAVLPTFLLTRLLLLVLTYFGGILFNVPNNSSFALTARTVLYSWYHWDAPRYLTIASQGYIDQSYMGFFPLYPVLVHTISLLVHRDILLIGMIVSNLSFFAALVVFYRLVAYEFEAETAARSVLFISIFPTALLFFTAYNTSTLFFLLISCFYLLRRSRWWLAGFVGLLAALTDFIGILLFIIFIYEFTRQYIVAQSQKTQSLLSLLPLLASLLIPLGTGIYSSALARKGLDRFAFLHPQSTPSIFAPWTMLASLFKSITSNSVYSFGGAHGIFELLVIVLFIAALVLCFVGPVRLTSNQWSFGVFGILLLLFILIFPTLPGGMQSQYDPIPALLPASLLFFIGVIIIGRLGKRTEFSTMYLLFSLPMLAFFLFQLFTAYWTI